MKKRIHGGGQALEPRLEYRADKPKKRKGLDLKEAEMTSIAPGAIVGLKSNEELADRY